LLELRNVAKTVFGADHIRDVSLTLRHGSLNVLLGPTLSGKTSLMRLMAGLDRPTSGSVWFDGTDVTGVPVQKRNVAMVYQQFINYPAMTVYENIASPLRVAGAFPTRCSPTSTGSVPTGSRAMTSRRSSRPSTATISACP
jgi:glycerol transport system ATP-binding protein